jgi:ABC-2 type transport system permease protein/lipopolysaccharide transport system permease protein
VEISIEGVLGRGGVFRPEIVRAPLLGSLPSAKSYAAVLLITLVNVVIVGAFFARFRSRISYWV